MCGKMLQYDALLGLVVLIALKNCAGNYEILKYFQKPDGHFKTHNRMETHRRVLDLGYPCEKHNIQTDDGYIISIFHMPYSNKTGHRYASRKRPTVLLQHGMLSTSDGWILNGPDNSLPFMLADQGFDVWLGNARGNLYGRKHTNLTASQTKFWRFSWHEIGYYDLATTIDYILANNDQAPESLHYIGYSQGCTILMVLLSLKPEYQQQLKTINFLAPAVYFDNTEDPLFKILGSYLGQSNIVSQGFASREFMPFNELYSLLAYNACKIDSVFQGFCSSLAFLLEGFPEHKNQSAMHILMETHPGGTSTDQIIHYTQIYQARSFRQYDFGFAANLLYYNQSQPPVYPLENIQQHLHIWYSVGDRLTSWKDMLKFPEIIPNVVLHRIPDDRWSHGDFLLSLNSRVDLIEPILNNLKEYEIKFSNSTFSSKI